MPSFLKFTIYLSLVASIGAFAGPSNVSDKEKQTSRQTFIVMRHAHKQKGKDPLLTLKGMQQAKSAAIALETLRKEQGKEKIQIVVSNLKRSQQTGKIIAQELGIPESDIIIDRRICEIDQDPGNSKAESKEELYQRMHQGIGQNLHEPEILTVFVSHGKVIKNYFHRLSFQEHNEIPIYFQEHHANACEMYLIHREADHFVAEKILEPDSIR